MTKRARRRGGRAGFAPVADEVRAGRRRAADLVAEALARIEQTNADLNSFVYLDAKAALEDARRIDDAVRQGRDPGPLAGIPFGVKDLEDCAGMPTSQGSVFLKGGQLCAADSLHVRRLRTAGAVPMGKTATAEFGMDSATHTKAWGTTRNPWNLSRTPGGSSGGSASAVASGQVLFATASDAAGSTRSPAANTALVGLKPSHGRIARESGSSPVACLGALTRTVRDTARYLDVAGGPHDRDRMTLPDAGLRFEKVIEDLDVSGIRVAWSDDLGYMVADPEVVEIAREAANRLIAISGARQIGTKISLPNVYPELVTLAVDSLAAFLEAEGFLPERYDELSDRVRQSIERYGGADRRRLHHARMKMNELETATAAVFAEVDVVLTPATTCAPFTAEGPIPERIDGRDATQVGAENYPTFANVAWNPSIAVPAGLNSQDLPVGLLITGRRFRDDVVLRLARLLEQDQRWPALPELPYRHA